MMENDKASQPKLTAKQDVWYPDSSQQSPEAVEALAHRPAPSAVCFFWLS